MLTPAQIRKLSILAGRAYMRQSNIATPTALTECLELECVVWQLRHIAICLELGIPDTFTGYLSREVA